eukprot:2749610-Prymnesium_polylepis.1
MPSAAPQEATLAVMDARVLWQRDARAARRRRPTFLRDGLPLCGDALTSSIRPFGDLNAAAREDGSGTTRTFHVLLQLSIGEAQRQRAIAIVPITTIVAVGGASRQGPPPARGWARLQVCDVLAL